MKINLIAAMSVDGVIGIGDSLPWTKQRGDMNRFKTLTAGAPVLVGHSTYKSIRKMAKDPNDPLPGRRIVVVSNFSKGLVDVCKDCFSARGEPKVVLDVMTKFFPNETLWVIGGASIYEQYMPFCEKLYLTKIFTEVCDSSDANVVRFPFLPYPKDRMINGFRYKVIENQYVNADENNEFQSQFITYEKQAEEQQ